MKLTTVQDLAIQARLAMAIGAKTFDRLFLGIRFDELDGDLLYAYAMDEDCAAAIEDDFGLDISIIAAGILGKPVEILVVMPKILQ